MKPLNLLIIFLVPLVSYPQCKEVQWPESAEKRADAESQVALYSDAITNGDLQAARKPLAWMYANNPEFNESLYINGIKVYNELIEKTENENEKKVLFDSLMLIYDQRITQCGDHSQLIARKAYDAYRHTVRDTERLAANLKLFDTAFEKYGADIGEYMLLPYMNLARYNYKPAGNISEAEMTERYEKIQEIIQKQSEAGALDNKEQITNTIDDVYFATILGDNIDCSTIKEKLEPRLNKDPSNIELAKQIFGLMVKNKCTEDPLWLEVSEIIVENDPNYGLYKIMGQKFMSNGEMQKARVNFNKAADLAKTSEEKSEIYLLIGSLHEKSGSNAEARTWYQKAIQEGSTTDAYNALGYLYYRSSEDCMEKENRVRDRAIFILAHEMFVKAGNAQMAAQTKEQFPSKEEIFMRDYNVGDLIDIRCWVQQEVKLQTRD